MSSECNSCEDFLSQIAELELDLEKAENKLYSAKKALEAANKYHDALCGKAKDRDYETIDSRGAIANGADLDALFFDWMKKTEKALERINEGKN